MTAPISGDPALDALIAMEEGEDPAMTALQGMTDLRRETARGRRQVEAEDRMRRVQQLDEILARPDISDEQRERVQRMRDNEARQWTRPVREDRSTAENIARGVATGLNQGFMSAVDLVGGVADLAERPVRAALGSAGPTFGRRLRNVAQESMAEAEEFFDPQGAAGLTGTVAGSLLGAAGPYTKITLATGRQMLRVLPANSRLANVIRAYDTGTIGQRIAGQTAMAIPVDAIDALLMEDATWRDRLLQFGITTGANVLGAAVIPARKPTAADQRAAGVDPTPERAAGLEGPRSEQTGQQIDELVRKGEEQRARRQMRANAKKAWIAEHSDEAWKKLDQKQREAIYAQHERTVTSQVVEGYDVDTRTGLGNQASFDKLVDNLPEGHVIVFGDANGLKDFNDRLGQGAGDAFLNHVGQAARVTLESLELDPRLAFRAGGDEFALVVPREKAEQVRAVFEEQSRLAQAEPAGRRTVNGSVTAEIFESISDVNAKEGKDRIGARKIQQKAEQGIPGRDAAEQKLIDEARAKIAHKEAGQGSLFPTPHRGVEVVSGDPASIPPGETAPGRGVRGAPEPGSVPELGTAPRDPELDTSPPAVEANRTRMGEEIRRRVDAGEDLAKIEEDLLREIGGDDLINLRRSGPEPDDAELALYDDPLQPATVTHDVESDYLIFRDSKGQALGLVPVIRVAGRAQLGQPVIHSRITESHERIILQDIGAKADQLGIRPASTSWFPAELDAGGPPKTNEDLTLWPKGKPGLQRIESVDQPGNWALIYRDGDGLVRGVAWYADKDVIQVTQTAIESSLPDVRRKIVDEILRFGVGETSGKKVQWKYEGEVKSAAREYDDPTKPGFEHMQPRSEEEGHLIILRNEGGTVIGTYLLQELPEGYLPIEMNAPRMDIAERLYIWVEENLPLAIDDHLDIENKWLKGGHAGDVNAIEQASRGVDIESLAKQDAQEIEYFFDAYSREIPDTQGQMVSGVDVPHAALERIAEASYARSFVGEMTHALHQIVNAFRADPQITRIFGEGHKSIWDINFAGIGVFRSSLGLNLQLGPVRPHLETPKLKTANGIILLNPFAQYNHAVTNLTVDGDLARNLSHTSFGTAWHEILHNAAGGHGATFSEALTEGISPILRSSIGTEILDRLDTMWRGIIHDEKFLSEFATLDRYWTNNPPLEGGIFGHARDPGSLGGRAGESDAIRSTEGGATGRSPGDAEGAGRRVRPPSVEPREGVSTPSNDPGDITALRGLKERLRTAPVEEKAGILAEIKALWDGMQARTSELQARSEAGGALTSPDGTQIPPNQQSGALGGQGGSRPQRAAGAAPDRPRAVDMERLINAEHDRPLSELSMDELDVLKDEIFDLADANVREDGSLPLSLRNDIERLTQATLRYKAEGKAAAMDLPTELPRPARPSVGETPVHPPQPKVDENTPINPDTARLLFRKPIGDLSLDEAIIHAADLDNRITATDIRSAEPLKARLDQVHERIAELRNPPRRDGTILYTPPEVASSLAGFLLGAGIGDTDEERMRNSLLGGLAGIGAGRVIRKYNVTRKASPPKYEGQAHIRQKVKTVEEIANMDKGRPFLGKLEAAYAQVARASWGVEKAVAMTGGKRLPAHMNPGKLAAAFGHWVSQSEAFIFGRPFRFDPTGKPVPIEGVMSAQEIAKMVDLDTQTLGEVMAAKTTLEQLARYGKTTSNIDPDVAANFLKAVPERYHVAAAEARKLHLSLLDIMVDSGIISPKARAQMAHEEFYAPLERVFGPAASKEKTTPIGVRKRKDIVSAPNPVKGRTGRSPHVIRNPFETMLMNIPRTMRAAEMNNAKLSLIAYREANPGTIIEKLVRLVPGSRIRPKPRDGQAPVVDNSDLKFQRRVATIREMMKLDKDDASTLAAAFDPESLNPNSNRMHVWRNDVKETWAIDPYLAMAYKAMHPSEVGLIWEMLGKFNRPARLGIVMNPVFIGYQAFRDNFQAALNSQYGFVPGVDWLKGWWNIMQRSPEFNLYAARGGGHGSFASREVLDTRRALSGLANRQETTAKTVGRQSVESLRKLLKGDVGGSLRELGNAYHSMIVPFAEAARVGEYLRARGRGAAVSEAVYAAKEVVGNFQSIAPAIRGINQATLFMNPAIKALDQAFYRSGIHPFRNPEDGRLAAAAKYVTKGIASITIPSILLYAATKDDMEIQELRRVPGGNRFWFFRDPHGKIQRIPKPIYEGQLFGTAAEIALDAMKEQDPKAFGDWIEAISYDAEVNLLPTAMVVPVSLWGGRDLHLGTPIGSSRTEDLESFGIVQRNSSLPARVLSKSLSPLSENLDSQAWRRVLSPAGIDYLARGFGGTLLYDALQGIGHAAEYVESGYLAPKEEWPIIRGALVRYPTQGARSIRDFYEDAERIERRARTADMLARTDLAAFEEYFKRHQREIMMVAHYGKIRREIADLRQALTDIEEAPKDMITPAEKKRLSDEIIAMMIEYARLGNLVAVGG